MRENTLYDIDSKVVFDTLILLYLIACVAKQYLESIKPIFYIDLSFVCFKKTNTHRF